MELTLATSNGLTPWSRVLLENVNNPQTVKNYLTVYGARNFNALFIRARQWPLS